jgi:hypothetical protein
MRIAILAVVLVLSGCAAPYTTLCPGTRYYDPQICKGDKWQQIPNFENEAIIRHKRGERW